MKESTLLIIFVSVFTIAGSFVLYLSFNEADFNFYKSEISLENGEIVERLFYSPDKEYHTLFRFFSDPLVFKDNRENSIKLLNVRCEEGTPYGRNYAGACEIYNSLETKTCPAWTENNEYGCTFGSNYGFFQGEEYWIEARYELKPKEIFRVKGKNYVKFVAYTKGEHVLLTKENFIVNERIVRENKYYPFSDVLVYVPYETKQQTINIPDFEFDSGLDDILLMVFSVFLPVLLMVSAWLLFGREYENVDIPAQLSSFPRIRRGWEVSAYFNPPFSKIDKNFFASIILDFYHRKIIDIKMKGRKLYLTLTGKENDLDHIENSFLNILKVAIERSPSRYKDGNYVYLQGAIKSFVLGSHIKNKFLKLQKEIKKDGKKYIEGSGGVFLMITAFLFIFILQFFLNIKGSFTAYLFFYYILFFVFISAIQKRSALFIRFKEGFYQEYRHWQAFRKWLSYSFSMKHEPHHAVKLWEHYLVYSTALGVSKKVLKELKTNHLVDERHYDIYTGIRVSSVSFSVSSGTRTGGGGIGGGVGGGGGGGR